MTASILTRALQHERALVLSGLLAVVALSWAYLLSGAGTMQDMDGMLMPMSSGPWTVGYALLMLAMWAVMMAAMMLPSAAPMILLYATMMRSRETSSAWLPRSTLFTLGYIVLWSGFSVLAVALQFGLEQGALLSPMMETTSIVLAGAVLIAAGIYQWTPLKQACLRHCRSPLDFLVSHWRNGSGGAFLMGLQHGAYCVGCCWVLMLLLFVGGVMNLAWISGLAIYVMVEKFAPAGHWIGRGAGAVLIGWGVLTLLKAY